METHQRQAGMPNLPSMRERMPAAMSCIAVRARSDQSGCRKGGITGEGILTLPKAFEMSSPPYRIAERKASSCLGEGCVELS